MTAPDRHGNDLRIGAQAFFKIDKEGHGTIRRMQPNGFGSWDIEIEPEIDSFHYELSRGRTIWIDNNDLTAL